MSATCFVDTNVFVYVRDASEGMKQTTAAEWVSALWDRRIGRTGTQVLSEYYVTVTRKLSPGLTDIEAWSDIEDLMAWNPVPIDTALLSMTREIVQAFGLSWWDAQIVAAAQTSGSEFLLSEDLQDGQDLNGVQVVNPFRWSPSEKLGI